MKLILRRSVPTLGSAGDVVTVKPGYGRNYLVPQGIAYPATEGHIALIEEEQQRAASNAKRARLEAQRRASLFADLSLKFLERAGKDERLFGSVTVSDIARRLNELELGFELDRRVIDLNEPLKHLGTYSVPLRLHPEIEAVVEVTIEAIGI